MNRKTGQLVLAISVVLSLLTYAYAQGTQTPGQIVKFDPALNLVNSIISENSGNVGIGTIDPFGGRLHVVGDPMVTAVYGNGEPGVRGVSENPGGTGVFGISNLLNGWGVWGLSLDGEAGHFSGPVRVFGRFDATDKHFRIDHPLAPANKYMVHASVESAERMNLYDGTVILDADGEATVTLPNWFEALNRDFRYQLTSIGSFAPVFVAEEISGNHFKIGGGRPGLKVSWQVTGTRHDRYADAHPMQVEEEKPVRERGHYLHTDLYGQPEEKSIEWAQHPEQMRQMRTAQRK